MNMRLWYIEYGLMCRKYSKPDIANGLLADSLDRLIHNAIKLHKQYENQCNGDLTNRQKAIIENTIIETDKIINELFPARDLNNGKYFSVFAEYNQDPRGAPIKIIVDDQIEIIIPY